MLDVDKKQGDDHTEAALDVDVDGVKKERTEELNPRPSNDPKGIVRCQPKAQLIR